MIARTPWGHEATMEQSFMEKNAMEQSLFKNKSKNSEEHSLFCLFDYELAIAS